jgi:hypothetical protein
VSTSRCRTATGRAAVRRSRSARRGRPTHAHLLTPPQPTRCRGAVGRPSSRLDPRRALRGRGRLTQSWPWRTITRSPASIATGSWRRQMRSRPRTTGSLRWASCSSSSGRSPRTTWGSLRWISCSSRSPTMTDRPGDARSRRTGPHSTEWTVQSLLSRWKRRRPVPRARDSDGHTPACVWRRAGTRLLARRSWSPSRAGTRRTRTRALASGRKQA